ncbi:hypothetical protein CNMCM8980_003230 [Aspergillus fumigatiaffinis]|uniref:Enoyl-CoA hydratase/isomerase family protein n=1 Tax=Aspergillus fumigatiaffinis TaxID=340414 RepID=A0A8H4M3Q9_9EURO|nr:hypothetical protein CNMCM6805_003354 [Aspergillus fumigatiaffinis]KAF4235736.1 hypothetical protein CNMCM8980_003230 [Aspergillus fumigatiaffinis]
MTQSILITAEDGITTITINRPHRRNAVNPPTANALYNALLAFDADPAQKICILTGADGTFCAGADLHTVAAAGTGTSPSTLSTQENLQPAAHFKNPHRSDSRPRRRRWAGARAAG